MFSDQVWIMYFLTEHAISNSGLKKNCVADELANKVERLKKKE